MNAAPFGHAVAEGLTESPDYLVEAGNVLRQEPDLLAAGLEPAGFRVFRSHGTLSLTTNITPLSDEDGYTFCRELPKRCGAVAVPSSVLCDDKDAGEHFVRWMSSKRPEVLDEAVERPGRLR